jgi:hypothetical protein
MAKNLVSIDRTGLGFEFLCHRVDTPIGDTDTAQWRKIWSQCSYESRKIEKQNLITRDILD